MKPTPLNFRAIKEAMSMPEQPTKPCKGFPDGSCDKPARPGEKFCQRCKVEFIKSLDAKGLLTKRVNPFHGTTRSQDKKENRHETTQGID